MRRVLPMAIALLATGGCGSVPRCDTTDAQGIAAANGSKAQFRAILEGVLQRTVTVAMLMEREGAAGSRTLSKATDVAVGRHQAEWDQNVVASWNSLSPHEIAQVCASFTNRDRATYMRFATRVGKEAEKRNRPLVARAATEVVADIF